MCMCVSSQNNTKYTILDLGVFSPHLILYYSAFSHNLVVLLPCLESPLASGSTQNK